MLGKIEGKMRQRWQNMRWLDGITNSVGMNLNNPGDHEGKGSLTCYSSWGHKESAMTEQLNNRVNKCQLARQKYKVSGAGEKSFSSTICLIFASSSSCVAHRKKKVR